MAEWVRLCGIAEAPAPGKVSQLSVAGVDVCLANQDGRLSALDNWCPHRRGPLGEGWIEGGAVVCPWHAWAFDLATGECPEEKSRVDTFPLRSEGDAVWIDIA